MEDHSVSLNARPSLELGRYQRDPKVAPAIAGTGMAFVKVAFVFDLQVLRCESLLESASDHFLTIVRHGGQLSREVAADRNAGAPVWTENLP